MKKFIAVVAAVAIAVIVVFSVNSSAKSMSYLDNVKEGEMFVAVEDDEFITVQRQYDTDYPDDTAWWIQSGNVVRGDKPFNVTYESFQSEKTADSTINSWLADHPDAKF